MYLARKAVGRHGVYEHAQGEKRQYSNSWVRESLGISNVKAEMAIRRLGWYRDMLLHPDENVQLRAALVGRLTTSRVVIHAPYHPWLLQLVGDIRWMLTKVAATGMAEDMDRCHYGQGCLDRWVERDTLSLLFDPTEVAWFMHLTVDPRELKDYGDPPKPAVRPVPEGQLACDSFAEDGAPCQFVGGPAALGVHKFYHHGQCNPIKATVLMNQCP